MRPDADPPMSSGRMEAAVELSLEPRTPSRGDALLLHHCRTFARDRAPARERLEQALGPELSRLLVGALVPRVQGFRGSSSP
jgi:hypothetical protein